MKGVAAARTMLASSGSGMASAARPVDFESVQVTRTLSTLSFVALGGWAGMTLMSFRRLVTRTVAGAVVGWGGGWVDVGGGVPPDPEGGVGAGLGAGSGGASSGGRYFAHPTKGTSTMIASSASGINKMVQSIIEPPP